MKVAALVDLAELIEDIDNAGDFVKVTMATSHVCHLLRLTSSVWSLRHRVIAKIVVAISLWQPPHHG